MWILCLLLQISLNNHSEYWLAQDSLSEHFESYGSVILKHGSFVLTTDYLIEDNIYNTPTKYTLLPALEVSSKDFTLDMGYIQKTAVSGLLLNETNDMQFKRFRYLKGISVAARTKYAEITLFTGKPRDFVFDGLSYVNSQDTADILRGVTVNKDGYTYHAEVGYIRLNKRNMPDPYAFTEIFGGEVGIEKDKYSVNFDFAGKQGVDYISYARTRGYGLFCTFELMPSSWNILFQFAFYNSINLGNYNLPPVPLKTEILPSSGKRDQGGSITFYYPLKNGSFEIGAGGLYDLNEHNFINPGTGKAFQEAYMQFDFYTKNGVSISIKPGYEQRLRIEPEYTTLKSFYIQSDLDFSSLFPVELFSRIDKYTEDSISYGKFMLNTTFYISDRLNIQLLSEYATSKIARYDFEQLWPSVGFSLNIEGGYISLFYGKQRGGLVCSGGMCRITPKFNGLKLIFEKSI